MDCKSFVLAAFLLTEFFQSFKLDECFRALTETLIEKTRNSNDAVHLLSRQLLFVLKQSHSCLHGSVVIPNKLLFWFILTFDKAVRITREDKITIILKDAE